MAKIKIDRDGCISCGACWGHVLKFTSKMPRMKKVKLLASFELRKTSLKEVWKGLWSNAPNKEQMAVPYR